MIEEHRIYKIRGKWEWYEIAYFNHFLLTWIYVNLWSIIPHFYIGSTIIGRAIQIEKLIKPNKALIIYGARRVRKTTLLNDFLSHFKWKYRIDSGDNMRIQHLFSLSLEYTIHPVLGRLLSQGHKNYSIH